MDSTPHTSTWHHSVMKWSMLFEYGPHSPYIHLTSLSDEVKYVIWIWTPLPIHPPDITQWWSAVCYLNTDPTPHTSTWHHLQDKCLQVLPIFPALLLQNQTINSVKDLGNEINSVSNAHFTDILGYFSPEVIHQLIQPLKGKNFNLILRLFEQRENPSWRKERW